jgi:hypothetical protein
MKILLRILATSLLAVLALAYLALLIVGYLGEILSDIQQIIDAKITEMSDWGYRL